jgi:hypothetical protein
MAAVDRIQDETSAFASVDVIPRRTNGVMSREEPRRAHGIGMAC